MLWPRAAVLIATVAALAAPTVAPALEGPGLEDFGLKGSALEDSGPQDAGPRDSELGFRDLAESLGLDFEHSGRPTPDKHLPEIMGSGVAWLDFDRDGRRDAYLVDVHPEVTRWWETPRADGANVLYRGGTGGFHRAAAGVADTGYGMGAVAADYDNDGWTDLFVTNYGPNRLYRNNGDGTFTDVTEAAGVVDEAWSTSAAWSDLDGDGWLDLFVANYVEYDPATSRRCRLPGAEVESYYYCAPDEYRGAEDALWHNRGDGTFVDRAGEAGIRPAERVGPVGNGLGVAAGDLDDDGDPDLYVANDLTPNELYRNLGGLRFDEEGLVAGVALGADGRYQAGMGVEIADLDGDLVSEIVVTNYQGEPYVVYRRDPEVADLYEEASEGFGVYAPTLDTLGFGVVAVDFDADGDLDLHFANGHVQDSAADFAQPDMVLENLGPGSSGSGAVSGRFRPVARPGRAVARPGVSRGSAAADVNEDGRPEILVTVLGARPRLLESTGPTGRRLVLRLRGDGGMARDALGGCVYATPVAESGAGPRQVREVRAGSSYASQSATDLYFGLGSAEMAEVTVRWPDGRVSELGMLAAGALYTVDAGRGVVASRALLGR